MTPYDWQLFSWRTPPQTGDKTGHALSSISKGAPLTPLGTAALITGAILIATGFACLFGLGV